MKSIQVWMGHSNFSTADLYAHTYFTTKLISAGAIEQALGGKKPAKADNKARKGA